MKAEGLLTQGSRRCRHKPREPQEAANREGQMPLELPEGTTDSGLLQQCPKPLGLRQVVTTTVETKIMKPCLQLPAQASATGHVLKTCDPTPLTLVHKSADVNQPRMLQESSSSLFSSQCTKGTRTMRGSAFRRGWI